MIESQPNRVRAAFAVGGDFCETTFDRSLLGGGKRRNIEKIARKGEEERVGVYVRASGE